MNYWEILFKNEKFKKFFDSYNADLNNALSVLEENKYPIRGRDLEISRLEKIMHRPLTPVALLIGQAGVGKTAVATEFIRAMNNRKNKTSKHNDYILLSLDLGVLSAIGSRRLRSELALILVKLKEFETAAQLITGNSKLRLILFVDEVHMMLTIFGPGTKIGGDVMKAILHKPPVKVIAATTRIEYDSSIATDKPLAERFKVIEMQELPREIVADICKSWWKSIMPPQAQFPSEHLLNRLLDANAMYRASDAEPRKSLDILEELASHWYLTGQVANDEILDDVFRERFALELTLDFDPDKVYANIDRRVKGQHFAKNEMKKLLRAMSFQLDPFSNKPLATALFTGPTGVGKTETVKALAEALYPGQKVLHFFNMPDFQLDRHEPLFRRLLGETIAHTPTSIILLDEFEKGGMGIRDSLLAILDEGEVKYEIENLEGKIETRKASLRKTIVIATTNSGQFAFQNDARWSTRNTKVNQTLDTVSTEESIQLLRLVREELISDGYKPEMLGRFNKIIPFRSLTNETFLEITDIHMQKQFARFKDLKGITIELLPHRHWPQDMYPYFANDVALYIAFVKAKADDTRSGGARSIMRELNTHVYEHLIDTIYDYPDCKHFKIYVSLDAKIYKYGAADSEGGIIVEPIYE